MPTPPYHTPEHWAQLPRATRQFVVANIEARGDWLVFTSDEGWTFGRSRSGLTRDINVGDDLTIEIIGNTQVSGLKDHDGWIIHLTDEDLAQEAQAVFERFQQILNTANKDQA